MDFHPLSPLRQQTEGPHWSSTLAFHGINTIPQTLALLCPRLSLVSLVLFLSPSKSSLKLFQSALLTLAQRSFFPFETGVPCVLPAGLVSCKLTHDKNPQNSAGNTRLGARYWSAGSSVSSFIIPCNWKNRGEHCLCSWYLNQLSQGPEVSLDCPWTTCCNFTTAYLENK